MLQSGIRDRLSPISRNRCPTATRTSHGGFNVLLWTSTLCIRLYFLSPWLPTSYASRARRFRPRAVVWRNRYKRPKTTCGSREPHLPGNSILLSARAAGRRRFSRLTPRAMSVARSAARSRTIRRRETERKRSGPPWPVSLHGEIAFAGRQIGNPFEACHASRDPSFCASAHAGKVVPHPTKLRGAAFPVFVVEENMTSGTLRASPLRRLSLTSMINWLRDYLYARRD
jgi:hypothetical protein